MTNDFTISIKYVFFNELMNFYIPTELNWWVLDMP